MQEKTPLGVIIVAITLAITIAATPTLIQIQSAHASVKGSTSRLGGTIAASGSNVYAAWWNNKTGDFEVMFRASTDNGHTFGPKINLSNSPGVASTDAQVGAEAKNVYVIWWETSSSGHTAEPFLRISYDNGKTFGEKVMLSNATAIAPTTSAGSK